MSDLLAIAVFVVTVIAGVIYDVDCTREGRPWW
jgi:hypothetical protein